MLVKLTIHLLFPKISTKKSMEFLSNKLTNINIIKKVNPKKITNLTKDGLTMELIEGLKVDCHSGGCFHFTCEDFDEQKLSLISKAFAFLSKIYDIGKEAKEVEFWLLAEGKKIPRSRINKIIRKKTKTDFEAQIKDLYQENVKVAGIRVLSPPDISLIIDITRVSVRMGPRKMTLDRFKDEDTIITLIEESMAKIEKVLEV